MKKLRRSFYIQDSKTVARKLLGKYLVFAPKGKYFAGKIVETEAYLGEKDLASHAAHGKTKRTEIMYGQGGYAYVYFTYGLFWLLNVVTEKKHFPSAVLIRALESDFPTSGPAKLTKAFGIDGKINGVDFCQDLIWIEDRGEKVKPSQIVATKRIGVDYAGKWKDKKFRFYIKGNKFVSKQDLTN